jgi:hypothetical protein
MGTKNKKSAIASVWNAGTAVNVLLIPVITVIFMTGGFYAYTNAKFPMYDKAASDVIEIQKHNAAQDEQVKQMIASLAKISAQLESLNSLPRTGVGGGAGGNSDGARDGHR